MENKTMTENVIPEWLYRNGKKVAPKTLLSQIMMNDGTKFEDKYQRDINDNNQKTNDLKEELLSVQKEITNLHPNSWEAVSTNIKLGLRDELYPLGKQFVETHKEHGDIKWEVNDYNHRKAADGIESPNMTLEMVNCIYGYMVDQYEFLHGVEGQEMPAGTYHFHATKPYEESASKPCGGNKDYQFTLTQPIPVGGGIALVWSYGTDIVTARVETYTDQWKKTKIETTTLSLGTGGTDLGVTDGTTLNHIDRIHFGNNNIGQSALIQYLNGIGKDWWHPVNKWDVAPSYVDKEGFLGGFSQDFIDSIVPTKHVIATNTVYETGEYTKGSSYEITCKMFPLSMTEVGLGANGSIQEGTVLDKYKNAVQADRIKTDSNEIARYWWLASPNPWLSCTVRNINPSGVLNYYYAYYGNGFAAACTIQ